MNSRIVSMIVVVAGLGVAMGGCNQTTSNAATIGAVTVRTLGLFVQPESCSRGEIAGRKGWLVSDGGCGYEQLCHGKEAAGSVVFVGDDGKREVIIDGLLLNNGVAQDSSGNVWVADDGHHQIAVRLADNGHVLRQPVDGAGLLNDVEGIPGQPGVWVSDSKAQSIRIAAIDGEHVELGIYGPSPAYPNGLAPAWDGDGVAVAALGDFKTPGASGHVRRIDASTNDNLGACAPWHGGEAHVLGSFKDQKLDGLVQFVHEGKKGYLASSIYDNTAPDPDNGLDTTLWFLPDEGGTPVKVFDARPFGINGASDIGRDEETGDVCIPDSNGSNALKADHAAGAKVLIVHGLR